MSEPSAPPAAGGESFGRYLSRQRELRGLSLENVADATKLSLSTLRALESDDRARLPERVFLVGAVKAYARAVGLSAEETVLRLEESLSRTAEASQQQAESAGRASRARRAGPLAVALTVAALLAAAAAYLHR